MGLLAVSWLSNFSFSLYYNIQLMKESFEWSKFFDGLLKLVAVVIGTGLLVVVVTFIPVFLQYVGLEIDSGYVEFFNILVIIGVFTKSIYTYVAQSYQTLNDILNFTK